MARQGRRQSVLEDQVLADVMTDKATVEIPSPVAGTVVALGGEVGSVAGGRLRAGPARGRGRAATKKWRPRRATAAPPADPPAAPTSRQPHPGAEPAARCARRRRSSRAPLGPPRPPGEKPIASPAVRRRARDAGVDLRQVRGSGPAGRIGHDDLDAFLRGGAAGRRAGGGRVANTERRDRQDHRPAPAHRPEDGGVEAPDPALLLCRGGRRHRARGAARHAQCREAGRTARASRCCRS